MSFQAMTWAVSQKCGTAGEKLVLMMLANHCNGHTGQCNPSHKLLAQECEMGVSTLKGHIAKLEARGLLFVERRFHDGVQLPNQYRLNLDGVGQILATNQELEPGIEPGREPGRGAKRAPSGFTVTEAMRQWAFEEAPLVNVDAETAAFCDHQFRTAHTDWAAAWRNWMRRANKYARPTAYRPTAAEERMYRAAPGACAQHVRAFFEQRKPIEVIHELPALLG